MTEEGDIIQVKLSTGEEIICIFAKGYDDDDRFRVHSILEMIPITPDDLLEEIEQYLLRPYVTYTEDLTRESSLNPVSVVMVSPPSEAIKNQYLLSVTEIQAKLGKLEPVVPTSGNVVSLHDRKQILTED